MSYKSDLLDAVREEIRTCFSYAAARGETGAIGSMVDLDAEASVLSAILCRFSNVKFFAKAGLTSEHFYSEINERLFRALSGETAEDILDALSEKAHKAGYEGDVKGYFEMLRDGTPFVDKRGLTRAAMRLRELSERRRLLQWLDCQMVLISHGDAAPETVDQLLAVMSSCHSDDRIP